MRLEKGIISTVRIRKLGEIKHFQVRIPKNAASIIGIESSFSFANTPYNREVLTWLWFQNRKGIRRVIQKVKTIEAMAPEVPTVVSNILPHRRNYTLGELKLQSTEEANLFHAEEIIYEDVNYDRWDFALREFLDYYPYSHKTKSEETIVQVDANTTLVEGIFQDRINADLNRELDYEVKVCVWVKLKGGKS